MTDHRGTQKDEKQKQEGINIGSRTNMGTRQNQRDHTHTWDRTREIERMTNTETLKIRHGDKTKTDWNKELKVENRILRK